MSSNSEIGASISLPEPPPGWFEHGYSVLMDGRLALIRIDIEIQVENAPWDADARARISVFDGNAERDAIELPVGAWPVVDRMVDGRWLVASRRAKRGELNGRFYGSDGTPASAFAMGDTIEHVHCAPDGTIWVGYFDEGVGKPISSAGIAQFAPDGALLWSLNGQYGANPFVLDCYALALNGNTLWSCFYADFPIIRIEDGAVRLWSNDVRGAEAIAVDGDHVLLAGGYGNEAGQIALLCLDKERARQVGQVKCLPLEVAPRLVQGQRGTLHIVGDGSWMRLDVRDIRAALGA